MRGRNLDQEEECHEGTKDTNATKKKNQEGGISPVNWSILSIVSILSII